MKLVTVFMWAGCAWAVTPAKPEIEKLDHPSAETSKQSQSVITQKWLIKQAVNALSNQAVNYLRIIVNNGSDLFGVPALDPLSLEHFHLKMPAGFINLEVELIDVYATGFGGFVTHRSHLDISSLAFEIDISVPRLEIKSKFELTGDMVSAIPLNGKGEAEFILESFRVHAMLYLKQSDSNRESVIINRTEDIFFEISHFESNLTGMIGGDDIDAIVNTFIEEMLTDYVTRFRGALSVMVGRAVVATLNPVLTQLDTWKYIAPFVETLPST